MGWTTNSKCAICGEKLNPVYGKENIYWDHNNECQNRQGKIPLSQKGKGKGKREKTDPTTIPLMKKSLKRWLFFYYKIYNDYPHPLVIAGLGDTWLKEFRKLLRRSLSLKNKNPSS